MRFVARARLNLRWRRLQRRIAANQRARAAVTYAYAHGDADPAEIARVCAETQRLADLAAELRRDVDRAGVELES